MHEPSDGVAEELERQLQLTLATAAIAARRVIAARQQALEQAQRESEHATRTVQARIDAERLLAAQHLRPVFDAAWWETANPQQIADMWQQAESWRDPDRGAPMIFDHAADRIREEARDRTGLDPTQITTLAAVQELEQEHQTTIAQTAKEHRPVAIAKDSPRAFDDPQRREQLSARLTAAGLPEPAIEARTLADLGQGCEAGEAARTPIGSAPERQRTAGARSARDLTRRR